MFSLRIQLWKAMVIIISFFLTGILISVAILLFTCRKLFHKNKISQSMKMVVENKRIDEEIKKENDTSLLNNEATKENKQCILEQNEITCETENKINYSKIKSKYWESINQRKSPKFKNFLHKSNKPFLGYNTATVQERKNSSLNDSKKIKNEKF